MTSTIEIQCRNTGTSRAFPRSVTLRELSFEFLPKTPYPVLGALVNHKLRELSFEVYKPKSVEFVDIRSAPGMRIYTRSLCFVLIASAESLFPNWTLSIEHSVPGGLYVEINADGKPYLPDKGAIESIKEGMKSMIGRDLSISRQEIPTLHAIKLFEDSGHPDKANLLRNRLKFYSSVYSLGSSVNYFYGPLAPSTGVLGVFDLLPYHNGMLLVLPGREDPNALSKLDFRPKMLGVFQEQKNWAELMGVSLIGDLNQAVKDRKVGDVIKVAEALHEKKIAQVADEIFHSGGAGKVVLIAGPSSSGKTTFSKRLAIQLKVLGLSPEMISLDNYFVDRDKTPRDEKGDYDFESLQALDVEKFNLDLLDLLGGKEVLMPRFSFTEGKRYFNNHKLKLRPESVLIIEGIHALNPALTPALHESFKFMIYVSALTTLAIDRHNRIPTTDNRLLRRLVRDHKFRGYQALETLRRWASVRQGEEKHIFPFQEEADVMFNTATIFELGVIKRYAEPLLSNVPENEPEYAEAYRLLKFLSYFVPIPDREIPPTSILREFFGGSSFFYD